jgi:hypothetical protein
MKISFGDLVGAGFPLAVLFCLMTSAAYRIRLGIGRRWLSVLLCAMALTAFVGFALTSGYLSYRIAAFAETLRNPRAMPKLPLDWGSEWPPENRTKYSKMLAEIAYKERGESSQYFDLRGELLDFVPTAQDRQRRDAYLTWIQTTARQAAGFAIAAVILLILPILSVLAARTRFAAWLSELESRLERWRKTN